MKYLARPLTVVSYGGGVNSAAMVVGLLARGERPDAILFADTRGEKPGTYAHIDDHVKPWLRERGCELTIVCRADFGRGSTGDASLEAECLRLELLPSRAYGLGTCAIKWKIDPQHWWCQKWQPAIDAWARGEPVTRCIGYDAGEERRVKPSGDRWYAIRHPLIEWGWDRDRCVAEVEKAGLPVPPKSACFYCPSSRKAEIMRLAVEHPDLFERAQQMEDRALASGTCGLRGLGRRFSWRELVEANDRSLFPERPVEGCVVCADGEIPDPPKSDTPIELALLEIAPAKLGCASCKSVAGSDSSWSIAGAPGKWVHRCHGINPSAGLFDMSIGDLARKLRLCGTALALALLPALASAIDWQCKRKTGCDAVIYKDGEPVTKHFDFGDVASDRAGWLINPADGWVQVNSVDGLLAAGVPVDAIPSVVGLGGVAP